MRSNEKYDDPAISVVITCYNYGQYVEEAVASCLNSTFQDFEIIIVNDGSTDAYTLELLEQWKMPKTRVIHQHNQGLPAARNRGIREARGKYVFPLDADDKIHPTLLEKGYWIMETRPSLGFVTTWLKHFGDEDWIWRPPSFHFYQLLQDNIVVGNSLIRKSAWESVGGYNESMTQGYEDWDFWIKLSAADWRGYQIQEPLFLYRKHGDTMLNQSNVLRMELTNRIKANHANLYEPDRLEEIKKLNSSTSTIPWNKPFVYDVKRSSLKKIHVMFIMPWLKVGGAEKVILDVIKSLPKELFEILIVTSLDATNEWATQFEEVTSDIYYLNNYFTDKMSMDNIVIHLLETHDIDIVNLCNSELGYDILPSLKKKYPQIICVSFLHAYVPDLDWDYVRKAVAKDAYLDHHIVIKQSIRDIMVNKFCIDEGKISVIPNSVNTTLFSPISNEVEKSKLKQSLGFSKDSLVVSFFGRLESDKDPLTFVQVAEKISELDKDNRIQFLMVGTGQLKKHVIQKLQERIPNHKYVYLEHSDNINQLYKITDLLISTSPSEGLPLVGLEAMSTSIPVLAYCVPGWEELVQNHKHGKLIQCSQHGVEEMAMSAMELLQDDGLRMKMGEQGRIHVKEYYDSAYLLNKYLLLYQKLIKESGSIFNEEQLAELPWPPLVNVVITSNNPGAYLYHAIRSVINQSSTSWRITLVDDASTDDSLKIIRNLLNDARITLIKNESNLGQSKCLNIGLSLTETPFILQLDADDWLELDAIESLLSIATVEGVAEDIAVFGGNLRIVDEIHGTTGELKGSSYTDKLDFLFARQSLWPRFYRTSALLEIGGWPTDDQYEGRYMEDKRILIKLMENYKIYSIDKMIYNHRRHDANLSNNVQQMSEIYEQTIVNTIEGWTTSLKPVFGNDPHGYRELLCITKAEDQERIKRLLIDNQSPQGVEVNPKDEARIRRKKIYRYSNTMKRIKKKIKIKERKKIEINKKIKIKKRNKIEIKKTKRYNR